MNINRSIFEDLDLLKFRWVGLLKFMSDSGGWEEVSTLGTNYSRVKIPKPNIKVNKFTNTINIIFDLNNISFDVASSDWGEVHGIGLFDSKVLGNHILTQAFPISKIIMKDNSVFTISGKIKIE